MSEETWYYLDLGNAIDSHQLQDQVQAEFAKYNLVPNCPKHMAVFSPDYGKAENDNIRFYFTPPAYQIAEKFNATPCEKPLTGSVKWSGGDALSVKHFFPEG